MGKRKGVSPSLRWSVFARDGFCCRYCGAQAGQDGVELHCDHVVSVNEGGDNRFDNLVTACQKCNGGKAARSLRHAPTSEEVIDRIKEKTATLLQQGEAIAESIRAAKSFRQNVVNLKCAAYDVRQISLASNEATIAADLSKEFGADILLERYQWAARAGVKEYEAIKYVCGCARRTRERMVAAG